MKKNQLAAGKQQSAKEETKIMLPDEKEELPTETSNWRRISQGLLTTPDEKEKLPVETSTTQEGSLIQLLTESQDNEEDNWEEKAKPPVKEDILLVYPFLDGEAIEKAAQWLLLYEERQCTASFLLQLQQQKCHPRNVLLIISKKDHECLNPGKWLNDILIDFWMQWITWMELQPDSLIHIFTTHFYTKLSTEEVESVIDGQQTGT
jgi:hypothetical protein